MKEASPKLDVSHEAASSTWDAIVVGAGPAGSLAARQLSRAGLQTLLVDAKHFPRDKACGGYLNGRALDALHQAGLSHVVPFNPECEVRALDLIRGRQRAHFALPAGQIICRSTFDQTLLSAAKAENVEVRTGVQATVEPRLNGELRIVKLTANGRHETAHARVVVCADGLSRLSTRQLPEFTSTISPSSRVGLGAVVDDASDLCRAARLTMIVSPNGYVGISRINPTQLNIAAAVDPATLAHTTPHEVVTSIFRTASFAAPAQIATATWRGTPGLTSRPRSVAAERVFLIGDASGYIEPFTGEGMAAALESAAAVVPFVLQAATEWSPHIANSWQSLHRQIVSDRQYTCRTLAWILRRPWATFATMTTCRALPVVATRWISKTSTPSRICATANVSQL